MLDPCLSFLGLLNKGGNLVFGESLLYGRNFALVLLATDIAPAQKKKFDSFLARTATPSDCRYSKAELGAALGYPALSAIGIKNAKAAKAYLAKAQARD